MPTIKTKDNIIIQGVPQEVMGNEALLKQTVASLRASSGSGTYSFTDVAQGQARPEGSPTALSGSPEQQAQLTPPEPGTSAAGLLGGFTRGAGPTAIAGGLGAVAGAVTPGIDPFTGAALGAIGMETSNMLTPYISDFLNKKMGTEQMSMQQAMGALFDKLGVEQPDTEAEKMAQAAGAGLSAAGTSVLTGGLLQGGLSPGNIAPKVSQRIGQVLAESPTKQVVGGAIGGATAEKGAQIAEEKDMGPVGSFLLPLGLGMVGDIAGTGLVGAAEKMNKVLVARGMDLPDAAAEAIRLSQGRGEVYLSDFDPKTSSGEAGRSFRETTSGGTQDLRLARNQVRKQNIYDTMDDFGVVEGDYYARDIVDDFLNSRGDLLTKWKGAKDEVIDRLSKGGLDVGDSLNPEDAVDITKTLELISSKRAELADLGDSSLQPLINTLTNWEGALNNKNLTQIEFLRKRLRNTFEDPALAPLKKDGDRLAKEVYNSLNEEMGDYIKREGAEGDFRQWKTANAALADMMKDFEVDALSNLIKKGGADPSIVNRFLDSNDQEMAQRLYDGLSPEGRKTAQASIMADMAKEATDLGDLSPNQFARELDANEARKIFFKQDDGAQLDGLQKWLELTKRDEFSVGSAARPGSQLPGGQYALARGLWADPKIGIPVALAGKLGAGKFSQFLEVGGVRDLMIKMAAIPNDKVATVGMETAKRIAEIYRAFMQTQEDRGRGRRRGIGDQ